MQSAVCCTIATSDEYNPMMSNLLDNRYRVTSVLGSGGFGETYLAEDTKVPSNRRCVIKQLKPVADNPQMYELLQQRFHREAAVLETLGEESRYIPKLYANFTENGLFYLVQEWIDGLTLTETIERGGKWNEDAVRQLLMSILQTLIYVHDRGIIHRDIKPDNIILRSGEPVLIDFGAVKETLNVSTIRSSVQQVHSIVIGTPGFMASEQAAGRPFFASDLYSLAMTAIFALTGKYPQELGTDPQTGEVLWQPLVQGISTDLKAIFAKVLQFDPRDRYSSAREMLEALRPTQILNQSPPKPVPKSPALSNMQTVAVTPRGYTPPTVPDQSVYVYQPQQNPKKKIFGQLLVTVIIGGAVGAAIAFGVVVLQNGGIVALWNKIFPANQPVTKTPFYFLADSAFEDKEKANLRVEKLKSLGYTDAGLFWIPDYPNLGSNKFQQVYTGQFQDLESCKTKLNEHIKFVDDAYCAFASPRAKDPVQRISKSDLPQPTVSPTPTPTVTPSKTPTATPTPTRPSPEQAIRDYYSLINDRQFQNAWQNLTPKFQRDRAGGFNTFTDWWRTVDQVSVNGSRLVEINEKSAIIDIDLTYRKDKAIFPETLRMSLVWNESTKQWQISETQRQ
ncbi:serine/threonine-protein kinase [Pseudanabaena galeata UHCC 0370]|uniref:non-specific serine/threonine protein kinase n=1 Tax=Pseudanabaena galeata UHCC 0370 TaxID=3110310 RepID=A0ABU5TRB3_9CYAN|nr:serine/threonine-protein kinase [Pseudanabaena galeata]MEA5480675.1 serine/threonine-protein kinase [Pseudanabaena galeata UHCC 0370]